MPLHKFWWREVVRFWNRIFELPEGDVWRDILVDSLSSQGDRRRNWIGQISTFMSAIVYASCPLVLDSLDMQRVLELLLQRYSQVWAPLGTLPRLATSRVRLTTYHSWLFRGEWLDRPAYLFLRLPHRPLCQFVHFKLGCHSLAIETGR